MKKNLILLFLFLANASFGVDTFTTKVYRDSHSLGLKRTETSKQFIKAAPRRVVREDAPLPKVFDLTAKVSPPENQGSCGSCWDFSLTKALRSSLMIEGKDPGTLEWNYLLNNCGAGPRMYGCGGGDFDAGKSFLNGAGPGLDSQNPYGEQDGGSCKRLAVAGTALEFIAVGSGNTPTFKELATAIAQSHMLSIDVAVCGAWGSYSGGIFNRDECGEGTINHMINMVGYDCETSVDATGNCTFNASGQPSKGDGFLKVMNNWGTSWGENGYMRTRFGMDAVATTAMYFEVVKAPPVPPVPPTPPTPPTPSSSVPWWVFLLSGLGIAIIVVLILTRKRG